MLESADSNSICPVGAPRTESGIVTDQPVSDTFTVLGKTSQSVSYTHLDVYKRQVQARGRDLEKGIQIAGLVPFAVDRWRCV